MSSSEGVHSLGVLRAELLSTVRGVAVCSEDMLRSTVAHPLLSLGLNMDVEWDDGTEDVERGDALTAETKTEELESVVCYHTSLVLSTCECFGPLLLPPALFCWTNFW